MKQPKGFIVYLDDLEILEGFSYEQLGKLFCYVSQYACDGEEHAIDDPAVNIAYKFMIAQIRRDMEKYKKTCERNAENGKKGGRPRKNKETSELKTDGFF